MSKSFRKLLIYIALAVLPLFFIFSPQEKFYNLKSSFSGIALSPWKIIQWPFLEFKKIFHYHQTYSNFLKLQGEIGTLKSKLVGYEEVIRENNRYKKLLNFKNELVFSSVAANVTGRDPSNWNSAFIIDKGEDHDLKVGMPVVGPQGVIGKIAEVSARAAKVILLNDPAFSAAALVQRSREGCLISGTLKGRCRLRYLPEQADVEVGDIVITSKLSSSFPEGLILGTVTGLEENPSSSEMEWVVEPAVNFSQIEEVLVLQK